MVKVSKIIFYIVMSYLVMLVISIGQELVIVGNKYNEAYNLLKMSSDMALEQTQASDEFWGYNGRDDFTLLMPKSDGSGFEHTNIFYGTLGIQPNDISSVETIYRRLYDTPEFKQFADTLGAIKNPVRYFNEDKTALTWYYIPKVAMLGTEILNSSRNSIGVKTPSGSYVSEGIQAGLYKDYDIQKIQRKVGDKIYYYSPLNVGITYLNKDYLGTLFMNNVQVQMRYKFEGRNLNTPEGGNGILKGSTYADRVDDYTTNDIINNGSLSVVMHNKNTSIVNYQSYKGIEPKIEYKVIDMYDSSNDDILVHLFGAQKDGYSTKAGYLKELDNKTLNPITMQPYDKKPFVVAKVTFYLDVVIPYSSVIVREMSSIKYKGKGNSYLDIKSDASNDGVRRLEYTRYFAVTP